MASLRLFQKALRKKLLQTLLQKSIQKEVFLSLCMERLLENWGYLLFQQLRIKHVVLVLNTMEFLNSICFSFFFPRSLFIAKGGGGAQPNISKEIIVNTEIPLPSLAEQHRIVAEIEKWFALIDVIELSKDDLRIPLSKPKAKSSTLLYMVNSAPQDPNDEPAMELLRRINPKAEITCDNAL